MKAQRFIPLLVVAAGLLAYHNSFTGVFVRDDLPSIPGNPTIRHLWPIWQCLSPPQRGGITVEGRPFINLSLAVNYALGGYNVWGYHALNLTVHILAGLTLLGIVRRTLLQPALRERFGAAANELALATAVLWIVHPVQTESVTYMIQRAESIMGLFYLLTLYCFVRGAESVPVQSPVGTREGWPRRSAALPRSDAEVGTRCSASDWPRGSAALPSTLWFALSVVACALGMASKEVMVTAPLMVLLYDRAFLSNSFREAWRRRRPLYLGLAATWIVLGWLLILTVRNALTMAERSGITWWEYLATEPSAILYYLQLSVWPSRLCLNLGWHTASTWRDVLPSTVVIVFLLGATVWAWRRCPVWGFMGAWFFLILVPSSSFIPLHDPIYEHRMYLSLAAIVALVVMGLYSVAGRRGLAVLAVAAVGLGFLTWRRNENYRSELALWGDAVAEFPNNPAAHYYLGVALEKEGKIQEAREHYERVLQLKPDSFEAHNNLGLVLLQQGRVQEAMEHYELALQAKPRYAEALNNLGNALLQLGRVQEATARFEQALQISPEYAETHNNMGNALLQLGKVPEAIAQYAQALRLNPEYAEALYNRGVARQRLGQMAEAIDDYEQALRLKPDYAEAHNNLGNVLVQQGKLPEAITQYQQALQLKPDYAEAHNNLGGALLWVGKAPEAIEHFEHALRFNPDSIRVHYNLGIALEQAGRVPEAIGHLEQALRLKPDFVEAQNRLASLRAGQDRLRAGQTISR